MIQLLSSDEKEILKTLPSQNVVDGKCVNEYSEKTWFLINLLFALWSRALYWGEHELQWHDILDVF